MGVPLECLGTYWMSMGGSGTPSRSRYVKIAILGNMNNNGFALLRYLLDLGCDATLFLYRNDGVGSLSHFKPDADTFRLAEYQERIVQTGISNWLPQVLQPLALQRAVLGMVRLRRRHDAETLTLASPAEVRETFARFDRIVTSGYGPAILRRSGLAADIFSPYSMGIEGINRHDAPSWADPIQRALFEYARLLQAGALRQTGLILSGDPGLTASAAMRLGLAPRLRNCQMPMVYPERVDVHATGDPHIDAAARQVEQSDFSVMMHASLNWTKESERHSGKLSKNNHWLLHGFATLVRQYPGIKSKLILMEYGYDVRATRELASQLEIESNVLWVPKTARRNIMWLLSRVTVGAGEFMQIKGLTWGGTGLEVLAAGRPLLQGFLFDEGQYEMAFGHPEPPLLKVRCAEDVAQHLADMAQSRECADSIGSASRAWFHAYNGSNLAKQWLDLMLVYPDSTGPVGVTG